VPITSITFEVAEPRLLTPQFDARGALWAADIKAIRPGLLCRHFANVLFVESHATASVLGMEEADGRPRDVGREIADCQQRFIHFLRDQTRIDIEILDDIALAFLGHEYACEAAATAAYVAQRNELLHIGVGYRNSEGTYQCFGLSAQSIGAWASADITGQRHAINEKA
jgi:hypothetical protein